MRERTDNKYNHHYQDEIDDDEDWGGTLDNSSNQLKVSRKRLAQKMKRLNQFKPGELIPNKGVRVSTKVTED